VKLVRHHNGRFKAAWLPKASTENERSTVVITATNGQDILMRQVAGAMARRIVTYLHEGDVCEIDEHMGFIKFGSRVDLYLPIGTKVNVELNQRTTGNETIIARLS
jgi:phosphatidylserine decarboxylase